MTESRVRIAVVGAGNIGTWHAKVIAQLADRAVLTRVVDSNGARARSLGSRYEAQASIDLADALGPDVDVVAICVPSGIHADVAIAALRAGKDVILEKPADISIAAVDRVIAAQRASGRLVTVISQHRYDPASRLVLDAARSGRLGVLSSGVASAAWWRSQAYYDSGEWRGTLALDGGGALMNQSIHILDLLLAAMGSPRVVHALTARRAHERIEVEDVAVAAIEFESGALGVLHATTAAFPGVSARLQIHGRLGSAIIDDDRLAYIHIADETADGADFGESAAQNQLDRYAGFAEAPAATGASDPMDLSDSHRYQYEDFLDVLAGGDAGTLVSLQDGRLAVQTVLAVYESARTGDPVRFDARA